MTTITFEKSIDLDRLHFKDIEEFQNYLLEIQQRTELSDHHKEILDERLKELENSSQKGISRKELQDKLESKRRP